MSKSNDSRMNPRLFRSLFLVVAVAEAAVVVVVVAEDDETELWPTAFSNECDEEWLEDDTVPPVVVCVDFVSLGPL